MRQNQKKTSFLVKVSKAFLPVLLIMAGAGAWAYFKSTAPVIHKSSPERQVTAVQVQAVSQTNARAVISAMGTVVPSRQVTLTARVSGEVQSVATQFIPGGRIAKGSVILSLDPSDHRVNLKKARSALEEAQASFAIEQGNQTIAREEFHLLSESSGQDITQSDLVLRKPQLQQAEAAVTSAEADLFQATLDLERTVVKAPFNAMIIERDVNVGTYVGEQGTLATIVGTDEFWVEALVPLDQLSFIDLDYAGGCPVAIRSQAGNKIWHGKVVRVIGKLNETSRMATVIVSIPDPMALSSGDSAQTLMINDYVTVEITGRELPEVFELPRSALQDGDTVWVCDNDTLDIRKVTIAWKSTKKIYVQTGLVPGDRVVVSDLSTPVQGMPLMIVKTEPDVDEASSAEKKAAL